MNFPVQVMKFRDMQLYMFRQPHIFRVTIILIAAGLLIGCKGRELEKSVTNPANFSQVSFSKTVRFPLEMALPINPILDASCTTAQKIVPLQTDGEFLSFRYQNCESKSVMAVIDNDSVEIILMQDMPIGLPLQHTYPPLKVETDNTKPPEEYLKAHYTTEAEMRYCKRIEKSTNIWEIKNIGFSPIPSAPSNEEVFADWMPPRDLSKRQLEKLRGDKINKVFSEHYARFVDQEIINRICDNLPVATYIFFEDEYVLTMPRYFAPVLDVTSVKYHKK